jgi:SAM-dependent methyltransferase
MERCSIKRLLHIGCGRQPLPEWLAHFDEVRVDIDPAVEPHFVRNMLDLHDIGSFDCIYASQCLEHLYPFEVSRALTEWFRVLNVGGACFIEVPDLEDVKPTDEIVGMGEAGEISGLDMIYGFHAALEANPFMAHHSGFVKQTLEKVMLAAGFQPVRVLRQTANYILCATGEKH